MIRSRVCIFVFISFVVDSKRCFHFCFYYLDLRKSTLQSDEVAQNSPPPKHAQHEWHSSEKHRQKGEAPCIHYATAAEEDTLQGTSPHPTFGKGNHHHCHLTGYATMLGGGKLSYILQKSMIDEHFGQDFYEIERHKPEG